MKHKHGIVKSRPISLALQPALISASAVVHNLNTQTRRLIHLEAVISWKLQAALDASATVHDPNWLMNELLGGSRMVGSLEMGPELSICPAGEYLSHLLFPLQVLTGGFNLSFIFPWVQREHQQHACTSPVCTCSSNCTHTYTHTPQ